MIPDHIHDAIYEYLVHMEGWCTPERGCEMADRILETKAQIIVDIGVFAGRSTLAMGFAARELQTSMVYGIDPWKIETAIEGEDIIENVEWWQKDSKLEEMHRATMRTIWSHQLDPWITIIRNASHLVSRMFPLIDFINIDGSHTELASCRDVMLYLPKLRSGNFLTFDDADWRSTQKALSMIEQQCDLVKTMKDENNEARVYRKR